MPNPTPREHIAAQSETLAIALAQAPCLRRCSDYDEGCHEDLHHEGIGFIVGCFLGTTAPYPADGYCPILHGEN